MSEFQREEELLRKTLVRREPRDGFAERVLARLDEPRPVKTAWWSWLWSPAFAAALLMIVLVAGAWQYSRVRAEQQRRVQAERALHQLERALQIAESKMELAQTKIFRTEEQR